MRPARLPAWPAVHASRVLISRYANVTGFAHCDKCLGGTLDVTFLDAGHDDGEWWATFSRKISTGDVFDHDFVVDGTQGLMVAYGFSPDYQYHGPGAHKRGVLDWTTGTFTQDE